MASEYEVLLQGGAEMDFHPQSLAAEVIQNVRTILSTPRWSVPLDRAFGIDASMLDRPVPDAMAALSSEIYMALRRYEPRCRVKRVSFEGDLDGRLVPKVRIEIDE